VQKGRRGQFDGAVLSEIADGIQYRLRHVARGGKVGRSYIELGEAILRGELRIQDIDGTIRRT
jgi:hypothetical protein